MKAIFLLIGTLTIAGTLAANAQLKKDTALLKAKPLSLAPKRTPVIATQSDADIIPLTPTILQGSNSIATGSVKAKDLAILPAQHQ